ncbi:hypothetical protein HMPREF1531_01299 [Propionibacterium sp. oral taxon 192 str. F0372]|uniref:hypothetical protein n=1 Tax=Propionibacterium sp. oral taxon 192 TaxID=671222 RepID=UPI0003539899|nr:hypothetical protein [Propionibacterium sp. oral taxon 192]EPH03241.1 hypothetical protein HMPREF1531_01299 [Propionibacterium sp. oral taxon 192 str. F0372]
MGRRLLVLAMCLVVLCGCGMRSSTGKVMVPRGDETGLEFIDSTGLASEYGVWSAHLDPAETTGLMIYLHGDGHGEFDPDSTVLDDYAEVARRHHLLMLAAVTPDDMTGTWWVDPDSSRWLAELVAGAQKERSIDLSDVWLVGYSGGAEAITNYFMTMHTNLFTGGGAFMVAGGDFYQEAGFAPSLSDELKAHYEMVWVAGDEDLGDSIDEFSGYYAAAQGEQWFRERGVVHTSMIVLPGEDHFSTLYRSTEILDKVLSEG